MSTEPVGTRREMNKQATRQAIVDAALALLAHPSDEAVTATAIAEAAGISRRTLFNYFPSVDAILSYPLQRLLETVVEVLQESVDTVPLLSAAIHALQAVGVPELLTPVAHLGIYAKSGALGQLPEQSNQWQSAAYDIVAAVESRYPHAEPFEVRIFSHSILGAGQAAFDEWFNQLRASTGVTPGDRLDITAEHIALLHTLLTYALEQLRDGFPSLLHTISTTTKDH